MPYIVDRYQPPKKVTVTIPYAPLSHQLDWHNCPTRFLVAVTGRQIGKTTASVNELIKRALSYPNSRNWYVTNDYRQAKRNVWDEVKRYIVPEMHAKMNETELKISFPNGSLIELIGVENAEKLRGAVVHFMILDEYADFSREVWSKVLSPMMTTTNGQVWFIGTPKGMGNDFYDKYYGSDVNVTKYKIPAVTLDRDNTIVSVISKYASMDFIKEQQSKLPKDAFDQEYLAEFTRPSGTVYDDWPLENYKSCPYDVKLPLHITMDFGVNDPTSIVWIQPNGSEYRVIDYYEATDANIDHYISVILSKPYKSVELYTGDPSGKSRTLTTGTSPIEILNKRGIYVRTKDGVKIPDQIRSVHEIIKSLYVNSDNEDTARFRDCLLNYRYPQLKDNVRNKQNEIPIHDEFSHAMRAMEYYAVNIKDVGSKPRPKIVGYTGGDPVTGFGRRPIIKTRDDFGML